MRFSEAQSNVSPPIEADSKICPAGPHLTIRHEDIGAITRAMNSFDKLTGVYIECIGSSNRRTANDPFFFPSEISVKTNEFTIRNSQILMLTFRGAELGSLTIKGDAGRPSQTPSVGSDTKHDIEPTSPLLTNLGEIWIVQTSISRLAILSASIGDFNAVRDTFQGPALISRSEFGALAIIDSKLQDLSLFQLRIGTDQPTDRHYRRGALHITGNKIEGDLRIGPGDELASSLLAPPLRLPVDSIERIYGPLPTWVSPDNPWRLLVSVRGYVDSGAE